MTTNQDEPVVPSLLLEGLALDVSILQSLLKRHRCNHGRTLYYRRMEMALKSIRRSEVLESIPFMNTTFTDRVRTYQQRQRKQQQKRQRYEKKTKLKEEEQWTLEPSTTKRRNDKNNEDGTNEDPMQLIWTDLRGLIQIWTTKTEEIISRIHHAAKMLFVEVSRGFFLPFCSVALASIARIRAMLMEIGRLCLSHLYNIQNELLMENENDKNRDIGVCLKESQFCHYMGIYMEGDEPTMTLATRISNRNGTIPDVNETLAILGIPRPSSSSSKAKKNSKNKKRKATNENSLDLKKRKNEKTNPRNLQREEDTDEFISMDMELTTVAEREKFQDDKETKDERNKQEDLEKKEGTMTQKNSYSIIDGKNTDATDDEEGEIDKRPSSTEKKDRDDESNNGKDNDGDINALFRTSSKNQQEEEDTPKTTSKKKKKEKKTKTKTKKKKKQSSSSEDNFFDQLFS